MLLRWLISAVGFAALKGEVSGMFQRAARRALLTVAVLVLWGAAFGFAIAALTVWLADEFGAIAACGIIAAGFAVLGLIIQVGLSMSAKKPQASVKMPLPGFTTNADGSKSPDIGNLGSMAIVGIAGYLLGRLLFRK